MDTGERTPPRANDRASFAWFCRWVAPPFSRAGNTISSEDAVFLNNTKSKFPGFFAGRRKVHASVIIFRCKDRFAGFDKWQHLFLPAIEEVILDDGKIKMMDQILDLIRSILDSDREATLMRLFCQP